MIAEIKKIAKGAKGINVFYSSGTGDFNWNTNYKSTRTDVLEDADLVVFTGGADINPKYYNQEKGYRTHDGGSRDTYEMELFYKALQMEIPMFGICRGHQLICVGLGGELIQDVSHPSMHMVKTYDGKKFSTNSLHHQMIRPKDITTHYQILSWTEDISSRHLNGEDKQILFDEDEVKEIECIVYSDINVLSIQSHPEWEYNQKANNWLEEQIEKFLTIK